MNAKDWADENAAFFPMLAEMLRTGAPLTREEYLSQCYGDDVPEWNAELESSLPVIFQVNPPTMTDS